MKSAAMDFEDRLTAVATVLLLGFFVGLVVIGDWGAIIGIICAAFAFLTLTTRYPALVIITIIFLLPLHGLIIKYVPLTQATFWKELLIGYGGILLLVLSKGRLGHDATVVTVLLYVGYFVARAMLSDSIVTSFVALAFYVTYAFFHLEARVLLTSRYWLKASIIAFLVTSLVSSVGGIAESLGWIQKVSSAFEAGRMGFSRAAFSMGSSLVFGPFQALAATMSISLLLAGGIRFRSRLFLIALATIQIMALYFSFTRSAWFQFLVSIAVVVVILWLQGRKVHPGLVFFFLLISILVTYVYSDAIYSFFSTVILNGVNNLQRIQFWNWGISVFSSAPVFGVGLGKTIWRIQLSRAGTVAESFMIQLLAEGGIVGWFLFFLVQASSLVDGYLLIKVVKEPFARSIVIGSLAGILGINIPLLLGQGINGWPLSMAYWLFLALIGVVKKIQTQGGYSSRT